MHYNRWMSVYSLLAVWKLMKEHFRIAYVSVAPPSGREDRPLQRLDAGDYKRLVVFRVTQSFKKVFSETLFYVFVVFCQFSEKQTNNKG